MEKEIINETFKEEATHEFYCDGCNQFLGEMHEYEDGYYPKLGVFQQEIHLPDGWYCVERNFCGQCREKYVEELRIALHKMGFEKEW